MMCDARLFAPQISALSADWPIMVMPMSSADTVAELAQEILANAPPAFALAGLSMGGIVAMEVIRQAPERVLRLALMDTNPKAEHPAVAQNRELQKERVRKGELRQVMGEEMKPNYIVDGPDKQSILDLCMDMAEKLGPDVFLRQSDALATRPDQQGTLKGVAVPALVLCGRADALCPLSRHEHMHALMPHSTLVIIDNAGHLPTLEQPDQTTKALQEWMT